MVLCLVVLTRDQQEVRRQLVDMPSPLKVIQKFKEENLTYAGDRIRVQVVNSGKSREFDVTKNWWEGMTQPRMDLLP